MEARQKDPSEKRRWEKRGKDNRRLICESSRSNSLEGERHITFKPPWAADERLAPPAAACMRRFLFFSFSQGMQESARVADDIFF